MSGIFLKVLYMSYTASFAVLAVIIARLLLNKAPKIFSYSLWSVVLFRLVCPFSLESALSLMPSKDNPMPIDIVNPKAPAINVTNNIINNSVNQTIETKLIPLETAVSINPMEIATEIASIIWILGIIALVAYGIITYIKLNHNLSTATLVYDNIFETDLINTAFVLGIIKPKIIVPNNISKNEMNYIIKHEEIHIKRYDYLIKPIAFFVLVIHWFNPVVWLSYYLMAKDMEMSCDESVMKHTDEDIRADYSKSLLSFSVRQNGLLSPLAFGEGNVISRIKNVLNYRKPSFWFIILAAVIVITVVISFGTDSKSPISKDNLYTFNGTSFVKLGDKYFISEDTPENKQEELIYLDFLYTVNGELHKKKDILANIEPLRISLENESENTDPENYTSYVLHNLSTIPDKQSQNVEQIIEKYNITEYEIINAVYTQKHSFNKSLYLLPQWGDGTYSRNYIVGKSTDDDTYKIYEFLMPMEVGKNSEINSALLSSSVKLYGYEDYELISAREIIDANAKIDTILKVNSGDITGETSYSDVPKVPYFIKIEIDSNNGNKKEIYYMYEIHSKYYVEKPYEKIKFISYDDYRDIYNLCYLGTVPNPIYSGVIVSSLTDEEYSALDKLSIDNPAKDDFRKIKYRLYIEYPNNSYNKKVELPKMYPLIDKKGKNRFWESGSSFGQDNKAENFAIYENEFIAYVRGLNNVDIKYMLFSHNSIGSVTWNDENINRFLCEFRPGDSIIFEDEFNMMTSNLDEIGFFKNIISPDTFELVARDNKEKLANIFNKYMTEKGLKEFFENQMLENNYKYIGDNYIMSLEDMNIENIKESSHGDAIVKDYKISYTYMDNNNKKHELADYYKLSIVNNKIDEIRLDESKSSVINNLILIRK